MKFYFSSSARPWFLLAALLCMLLHAYVGTFVVAKKVVPTRKQLRNRNLQNTEDPFASNSEDFSNSYQAEPSSTTSTTAATTTTATTPTTAATPTTATTVAPPTDNTSTAAETATTISTLVRDDPTLSIFKDLLEFANLFPILNGRAEEYPFVTAFAPTNEALRLVIKNPDDIAGTLEQKDAQAFLLNHFVKGNYPQDSLQNGMLLETLLQESIEVGFSDVTKEKTVNQQSIETSFTVSNGILHKLNGALIPKEWMAGGDSGSDTGTATSAISPDAQQASSSSTATASATTTDTSNSSSISTTTTETSSNTPGTTAAAVCTQDGNECENGASCVLDPVSPANNFCKCVNGYFGKFCKGKHSDNNSSTINPVLPSDNNSNTINPVLTNQESPPSSTTASSPATSSPTANNDSSSSTTASKPITSNVANANEYDDDMFIMPTYNDDDSPNPIRNPNKGNSNLDDDEKAMWEITGNPKGDMWIIYEIVIPVVGAVLLIVSFAIYCCCCRKQRSKAPPEIFVDIDDNKDTPQDPELGDGLEDPAAKNDVQVDYLPELA